MSRPSLFVFTATPHKTLFRFLFIFSYFVRFSSSLVHFKDDSLSVSIDDAPAEFGVRADSPGVCGALYVADPLDGCTLPWNASRSGARLALIERGRCDFEVKVRNAQESGFAAVIVYNNVEDRGLVNMIGNSEGILVSAVFVSKTSGETLKKLAEGNEGECCLLPSPRERAADVFVMISFISVVILLALAGIFFCTRILVVREQGGHRHADSHLVEVLPCITFSVTRQIDQHARETCAICLEDYREGEKLKVLPCQHEFHATCIDSWLTKWGTFCPVCKRVINRPLRPSV